jgi:hypothetical protein
MHSPDQRERIIARGGALAALSHHPSWPDFEKEFERKAAELRHRAMTLALDPRGANQRELDEIRGSLKTLRWILAVPTNAEARLEEYLRAHHALEGEQEDVA